MKKYNIYAILDGSGAIDLSHKIVVAKDSAKTVFAIPFVNAFVFLTKRMYIPAIIMFLFSSLVINKLISIDISIRGQHGSIGFLSYISAIFGIMSYVASGILGNILHHKYLLRKYSLLCCVVAKGKKDALYKLTESNVNFTI